jgi:hypothetical protein
MSRPRIYEHLGRNPGIIYWQIRQPVTINMYTSNWIGSRVAYQIYILTTAPAFTCFHSGEPDVI